MSGPKVGDWCWHVHHHILVERLTEPFENRVDYIKSHKPDYEVPTRLRLFRPVKGDISPPKYWQGMRCGFPGCAHEKMGERVPEHDCFDAMGPRHDHPFQPSSESPSPTESLSQGPPTSETSRGPIGTYAPQGVTGPERVQSPPPAPPAPKSVGDPTPPEGLTECEACVKWVFKDSPYAKRSRTVTSALKTHHALIADLRRELGEKEQEVKFLESRLVTPDECPCPECQNGRAIKKVTEERDSARAALEKFLELDRPPGTFKDLSEFLNKFFEATAEARRILGGGG